MPESRRRARLPRRMAGRPEGTRLRGDGMSRLRSLVVRTAGADLAPGARPADRPGARWHRRPGSSTAVPHARGAVALTFDDGWGEANCERITRTLRANDVSATFFINGVHLNAQPAFWRRILRGFPVGNHTTSHFDLVTQPDSVVRQQIARNEAIHERVLGRPMLKVLRPPYGSQDARVRRIAGVPRLQVHDHLEPVGGRHLLGGHGVLDHPQHDGRASRRHHPHALRAGRDGGGPALRHPPLQGARHPHGRPGHPARAARWLGPGSRAAGAAQAADAGRPARGPSCPTRTADGSGRRIRDRAQVDLLAPGRPVRREAQWPGPWAPGRRGPRDRRGRGTRAAACRVRSRPGGRASRAAPTRRRAPRSR